MNRLIFVNLPVKDLRVARDFYAGLGFMVDERFSDDECACVVVSDTIFTMLLTENRFRQYIDGEISDAQTTTEVLNCLTAGSREEVDTLVSRAIAGGGRFWRDKMDKDGIYGHSFADPDGHAWEVLYMDTSAQC